MAQKVICLSLTVVGGIFSYLILLGPAFEVVQARWWTLTPCMMTQSEVVRRSSTDSTGSRVRVSRLRIGYRYIVDNKEYESQRYSFLQDILLSDDRMRKIVDRYSTGRATSCYFNPSNPGDAVLNRNFSGGMLLGLLPLLLLAVGLVGLNILPGVVNDRLSKWIDRQRARPSPPRLPVEKPALAKIAMGFYAALAFTGLSLFFLIAAVGDEFSNLSYLIVHVLILITLTIGYRRRIAWCAVAVAAYALVLLVSYFAVRFSSSIPSRAFSIILQFAPASVVPFLAQGNNLPDLFAAYVNEVAPAYILMIPIVYLLFAGARRLISERPAFVLIQVAVIGAVTAILLIPVIVASVQEGMRRFSPAAPKTPEEMMAALQSPDPAARQRVCEDARSLDPLPAHFVPELIRAAKEGDAQSRGNCIGALINAGVAGKEAIPLLVTATRDSSSYIRLVAAEALGAIGSKINVPEALPAILPLINDPDDLVRRFAVGAVQQFGAQAREAVPLLRKALGDSSPDVRGNAARALGAMASEAAQAIPELIAALSDKSEDVRQRAIETLGLIGPPAREAASALYRSMRDPSSIIRQAAIEAVAKVAPGDPNLVAALTEALKDVDHSVRGRAILGLGGIGPKAAPAVPALTGILSGGEIYLRVWAADALAAIGPDARAAVPRLRQMLTEKIISNESEAALLPEAVKKALYKIEGLSPERP